MISVPRRERRRIERAAEKSAAKAGPAAPSRLRVAAFAAVVVVILGAGIVLATGDLLGQRGAPTTAGAIPVRMSMAGFDPKVVNATPGQELSIDFWTTDAAAHLEGGVHTWISTELGLNVELPAESRTAFTFSAPMTPGDYDFWCDSCCGGKDSPTMHGTLRVEA